MRLNVETLEPRENPLGFDVLFSADPWFTPGRRESILAAFGQWAKVCADKYAAIDRTEYTVYNYAGQTVATNPPPVPADVIRVWVGVGPTYTPGAAAEAGPAGYSAPGEPLPRSPGWVMTFNPAVVVDDSVPAVALHEIGHVVGLSHESGTTPSEWQTAMYPYVNAAYSRLTSLDARRLLDAGHKIAPGTIIQVGTTPTMQINGELVGWMIYRPHEAGL